MPANKLEKPAKRCLTIRLDLDQHILKEGLRALIEGDQSLCCVDGELERDADVIIIDLSDNWAEEKIYRQGSNSDAQFVVLTELVSSIALAWDVRAVVAKTTDSRSFLGALRIVANGGRWLDSRLVQASGTKAPSLLEQLACRESLTNREREVATQML